MKARVQLALVLGVALLAVAVIIILLISFVSVTAVIAVGAFIVLSLLSLALRLIVRPRRATRDILHNPNNTPSKFPSGH